MSDYRGLTGPLQMLGHRVGVLIRRSEFSALVSVVFVYAFFTYAGWPHFTEGSANWLNVAAEVGLIALPVSLVMISGNLDLSVGSIIAAGAMTYAILSGFGDVPDWIGVAAGLAIGTFAGFINGFVITRTKIHSFIVTLGMMFALQGIVFGVTRLTTKTVLVSVDVDPMVKNIFGGRFFHQYENAIMFFLAMSIVVIWVAYKTKYGNWVSAIGGDETAARAAGVPVEKTIIWLYMGSGFGSALLGIIQVALFGSAQVSAGRSYLFWSIIAVVVGGVLLTGGYGSPMGVFFGTITFAIVNTGFYSTGWDSDWSALVLGVLLLLAVFVNNIFRRIALSGGRPKTKSKPRNLNTAVTEREETNV